MNEFAQQPGFDPASSPQVRTLLLTDLCDSTLLVERLGDGPAAELFRAHDRLVLELQQRWRGRLIDRSDGLLLLFERPVDGLGFALDYARGLRELADRPEVRDRKLALLARAGLHVGEVLTWQNSEAAVQAGAKPLEVEGLAKPLAGRLMTLARPGQILLSATAEPLARRAARELGERADSLIWKSHGRWRFKGVPDGQEVFEVGEPGFAPLRAPKGTGGKAWRDIPLWRRPTALAAELFLVAGLATGAWFLTRPQPAIAFNERDWVVVGDLRNLTGDPVLDESLEQAFRISLEQSRYVNVLSDLKVRDTLSLMKRSPETTLDRTIASEIAIRDGARAVILPTVAEVGGRVRVSAEVIDPHTQTTVYAESADGVGAGSALGSIDEVTAELREKLGEAIAAIDRDSEPLPKVSTSNLDALKAYSLGQQKRFSRDLKEAVAYFRRATELDPSFALAYLAQSRALTALADFPGRQDALTKASKLRDHLTPREQLLLDAELSRSGGIGMQLERWKQLVEMYPDSYNERLIFAQDSMFYANRYEQALAETKKSTLQQFDGRGTAYYLLGISQVAMGQTPEAIKSFDASRRAGLKREGVYHAIAYAVQRDYANADRILKARQATGVETADLEVEYGRMLIALDRGDMDEALRIAQESRKSAVAREPLIVGTEWRSRELAVEILAGKLDKAQAQAALIAEIAHARDNARNTDGFYVGFSESIALGLGYMGARVDSLPAVDAALRAIADSKDVDLYPQLAQLREVLRAERERLQGNEDKALNMLGPLAERDDGLMLAHASLMHAALAAKKDSLAKTQSDWLAAHRGRAFVEGRESALPVAFDVFDANAAERRKVATLGR